MSEDLYVNRAGRDKVGGVVERAAFLWRQSKGQFVPYHAAATGGGKKNQGQRHQPAAAPPLLEEQQHPVDGEAAEGEPAPDEDGGPDDVLLSAGARNHPVDGEAAEGEPAPDEDGGPDDVLLSAGARNHPAFQTLSTTMTRAGGRGLASEAFFRSPYYGLFLAKAPSSVCLVPILIINVHLADKAERKEEEVGPLRLKFLDGRGIFVLLVLGLLCH